jgi:predicted TIM-barrel fold metal-dependent hydrolase
MANKKGIGNIHTHHLDLRCLPENLTKQQGGIPEWVDTVTILDLILNKNEKRFVKVMSRNKDFIEVSKFHIEDMDRAKIDFSVVLHIDLEGADPNAKDKNYQYEEIIDKIAWACARHPFRFFPFFGFDPRRPNVLKMLKTNFQDRCYVGIKLYPALGFDPRSNKAAYSNKNGDYFTHKYHEYPDGGIVEGNEILENLKKMYEFASEFNIPVLTHCAPGGSYRVTVKKKEKYKSIWRYTNPSNFRDLARDYGLRICFGHMGGNIDEEENKEKAIEWNETIRNLIKEANDWSSAGRLFTDQSYDVVHLINNEKKKRQLEKKIQITKDYLDDNIIGNYVLFGSDWPLNIYKCPEKQYLDEYRKRLDKSQQDKYFSDNIARFLFGESRKIPQNYVNYVKERCKAENREFVVPDWVEEINGEYFLVK